MAIYTEKTNIDAKRFVPMTSRYSDSEILYWSERKMLTFTIYKKKNFAPSQRDKFFVITPGTEYRPDLVSQTAYGTVDFWWKIMEANNIKDIFEFKAGVNIRIPDNIF